MVPSATNDAIAWSTLLRKNASGMAADVEHQAQGEQFRIIDPASLPTKPYKPDLLVLNAGGLILGLVVGGGLGALQEFKDRTMHTDKDMRYYLPISLLGNMPLVLNGETKSHARKMRIPSSAVWPRSR